MNTTPPGPIRKFNPGTHQSDREVIRQFVVRHRERDTVLEILRRNIDSPSCQHALLVAPRGRGKTMLLARVEAELRTNGALSPYLFPVRFMEESLEIFDLADFWSEALFHFAREIEKTGAHPDLAQELRGTHAALTGRWGESNVADYLRLAVLDAADRLGRRLVLMVENLQALCDEQVDDDFGWKLRKTLQSEPRIMLLGSATSRFEALDDASQAFFELFHTVSLKPLSTRECQALWQLVTRDEVNEGRIRPMQILTGGSPRLLIMVAGFSRHGSLRRLMEDLVTLIDDHTEYFRGHLEAITAKKERRVYVSVIDLWQPSTTREIAVRARMDIRVVSSLLGRLIARGVIVADGAGKKKRYAAAERLYSLYYKLRRERDETAVVRNLLHFMAVFYDKAELSKMSGKLISETAQSPVILDGMKRAITEVPDLGDVFPDLSQPETMRLTVDDGSHWSQFTEEAAKTMFNQSVAQGLRGDYEAVMTIFDKLIERFEYSDMPGVQKTVAAALFGNGVSQFQRGDYEAAMTIFDKLIERFEYSDMPGVQEPVAAALFGNGLSQFQRGDHEAAIALFDKVVERYAHSDVPGVQLPVAYALFNQWVVQLQRGDHEAAMPIFDNIVERYGNSDIPGVQDTVATVLLNQGVERGQRGDHEAAMATFAKVAERYGDSDVPGVQEVVASALFNQSVMHGWRGDHEAAMATYDRVVERYADSDVPGVQDTVTKALIDQGSIHLEGGRTEEALRLCDRLESRLAAAGNKGLHLAWSAGWLRTKALLARKEHQAVMDAFRRVYGIFRPDDREMMSDMLQRVPELIASGASARNVADVLASDGSKSDWLFPLLVYLRQRAGETVRAPVEVMEVAEDIRRSIETAIQDAA